MSNDVNDEETEAEYEVEQDLDAELESEKNTNALKRPKFGRKAVLGGFIISIFLGGTLGVIGSKVFAGPDKTIPLRTEVQQSLDELRQSIKSQTELLGTAAESVQKISKSRLDTLQAENQALASQIGTIEQTLARLQNNSTSNLNDLADRIAILEALSGENVDMFSGTGSITSRLNALEENNLASDVDAASTKLSEETIAKVASGINRISAKPPVDEAQKTALDNLIDTFPRAKLLSAVKAQEQVAGQKTSWLKRILSRHVRVGNDNAPDPYAIIDTAETALKNGHITTALKELAKLNPPVRASAAEWMKAAKKAAPSVE